jgi:hypothetical protein
VIYTHLRATGGCGFLTAGNHSTKLDIPGMRSRLNRFTHCSLRARGPRLAGPLIRSDALDPFGLGTIHDAIADQLFPGTSETQTRLRFVLLIPWAHIESDQRPRPAIRSSTARRMDVDVARMLAVTGEEGMIGRFRGEPLRRRPGSGGYWTAIDAWGLRSGHGARGRVHGGDPLHALSKQPRLTDQGLPLLGEPNWHPELKALMPPDFPEHVDPTMRSDESAFIRKQWKMLYPGSLLTWLAFDAPPRSDRGRIAAPWLHPRVADFPPAVRVLVDHARYFSNLVAGANLLYHLHLSEVVGHRSRVESYRERLKLWAERFPDSCLTEWHLPSFWKQVMRTGHRVAFHTQRFVGDLLAVACGSKGNLADSVIAKHVIVRREIDLMGRWSRFANPAACRNWKHTYSQAALTYRWGIAATFLDDLHEGLTPR